MVWTKRAQFAVTDTVADLRRRRGQRSVVSDLCTHRLDLYRRIRVYTDVVLKRARGTEAEPPAGPRAGEGTSTAAGDRTCSTRRYTKHHARRIGPTARIRRPCDPARRAHRAKSRHERFAGRRIDSHGAGECRRASARAGAAEGGVAHCLLRLTKRSYQCPCGAGTSTSRMDKSTSTHWWLGRMAGC